MIAAPSLVIQPREGESPPHGGRQSGHFLALEVLQPAKNILLSQGTVTNESGGTISGFYGVYANSTISVVNDGVITGGTGRAYACTPGGIMRHHAAWRDPGAVFSGVVSGGNTYGSSVVSTLELALHPSAGGLKRISESR